MNVIKGISIFAAGVALGVGASYKFFEKKFGDIADEEIESVRRVAKNREMKTEINNKVTEDKKGKTVNAYQTIASQYATESDLEDGEDHDEEYEMENEECNIPYVISAKSFCEDFPDSEKITLTYYDDNNTMVDEDSRILDNPETLIGDEALESFGFMGDCADNLVYVRNEKHCVDYEIIRVNESYTED